MAARQGALILQLQINSLSPLRLTNLVSTILKGAGLVQTPQMMRFSANRKGLNMLRWLLLA
jgi:hypothetical protein